MHTQRLVAFVTTMLLLFAAVWVSDRVPNDEDVVSFFLVGDTHYIANKLAIEQLDSRSQTLGHGLIDMMNKLPGSEIPQSAGGGRVLAPRGVIHAGDCIDTGDQANVKMQQTEWTCFAKDFGLTGKDGRLKFPVYEVHGNHDSPRGDGLAVKAILQRNQQRPDVTNLSKNGLHYSWDWGHVHFICLGIVVGEGEGATKRRRYDPLGSLEFLIADLKEKVGDSGKPIVINHHVDMLRYARVPDDVKDVNLEWDPRDVRRFHEALKGYNIAAILYGHTHVRNVFRWDGSAKAAKTGIPVINVAKSSHYSSRKQAFFYLEIRGNTVTAREYQTSDGWETGSWTPQSWVMKS